jgi:hypothetical protein
MCKIKMRYLQLLFFTLTIYFLCFRLLGEFLLPSSNILPPTCQDLHAIMKYIGMEYQSIDACHYDHIMDNMHQKQNAWYMVSVDIEPIK